MFCISKTVVLIAPVLDAGYLILDILEFPTGGIRNIRYPETSIQDHAMLPMTCNTAIISEKYFMQLKDKY